MGKKNNSNQYAAGSTQQEAPAVAMPDKGDCHLCPGESEIRLSRVKSLRGEIGLRPVRSAARMMERRGDDE